MGTLIDIKKSTDLYVFKVSARKVLENTKIGESIATNGVCLTVTELGDDYFCADVMNESLKSTNFKNLKKNSLLNLERALSLDKRLDGHIVQGHVDSVGEIINIKNNGYDISYRIKIPRDELRLVVNKGSIAIDGISLTVSKVESDYFEVSIIPTTIRDTNLYKRKVGDIVNIETDILGKYVERLLNKNKKKIDMNFLIENGF